MAAQESRWFDPARHADRRPFLMARNRIVAGIRKWFAERDFVEVDCAALAISPGNEAHLHAFSTDLILPDGSTERRYLHTSPEFAAKKLLAAIAAQRQALKIRDDLIGARASIISIYLAQGDLAGRGVVGAAGHVDHGVQELAGCIAQAVGAGREDLLHARELLGARVGQTIEIESMTRRLAALRKPSGTGSAAECTSLGGTRGP